MPASKYVSFSLVFVLMGKLLGSQPQLYGSIITTVVAVLSLLVSKVLRKVEELSEKLFDAKQEQDLSPEPRPIPLPRAQKPSEQKIPPSP